MADQLCTKNLASISQRPGVQAPTYDRNVKEGIVHVGVGGFHRAHLAVYIDRLMEEHALKDWAICGVGLQPYDTRMRDVLGRQDHLYTVVTKAKVDSARVCGCIRSFLYAPDDREAVIAKMAHPDIHIVSLTITESGYYYNENTHELQASHPDIQHDIDPANKNTPHTTFGFLYAALVRRREQGVTKPFTVLSCDNMQKNGSITRNMLVSFAHLVDPAMADWIAREVAFPNSMVDRITPQTQSGDIDALAKQFNFMDEWPVVTEAFMQWVVEDNFSDGRPPFDLVGVQIVKEHSQVEAFEKHKLRLLNASHSAIGYPGQLAGFKYVHEVMEQPLYRDFLWSMMQNEVKPLLPEIPGVDIDKYCTTLLERFANPYIVDQLPRICLNSSGKVPQFIMPSVAEAIMCTGPLRRLVFVVAAWFLYVRGVDDKGNKFEVDDPMREELQAAAASNTPHSLLGIKSLFGDDLRGDKRFLDELTAAMEMISRDGVMASLPRYVEEKSV